MHPLDEATQLALLSPSRFRGRTHPHYANFNGTFGGFTAAVLLRAVLEHPDCQFTPVALTVNYAAALNEGEFEIQVARKRAGRSTQHWSSELTRDGEVIATASVVMGARRDVWSHHPADAPKWPAPHTVPRFNEFKPGGWTSAYDMRFVEGTPDFTPRTDTILRSPRSELWLKDLPERPLDYVSLACMSDAFLIRAFMVRGKFVPVGTVTLTTFFHADAEEMSKQGTDPLRCIVDAQTFRGCFADQTAQLWGNSDRLLATSVQMVWYKE